MAAGVQALDRRPFDGPPRGFSFAREIQPILDSHCVRCHHGEKDRPETKDHKPAFSLKWSASYFALVDRKKRKVCSWISAQSKAPMLPPYHTGASQSRLIRMHENGKHNNVKLSQSELERLITWIDLAVPCLGDYSIPQDNYFREKRRRWEAEEAENIRQYLARPR
jgi:hypothetical protein